MTNPYIVAEGVSYAYGREEADGAAPVRLALDGVDLDVRRGEFLAILGMNGSGKSTLARHLNALLLPRAGRVLVDGLDTREEANLWSIRDRVGMVFQNPDNQIVAAVVEEDVAFGPENQGLPSAEIRARVAEALEAVGMSEHRERSPHLLSGGQKQRVAIAGALAMRPACLVLDEPTAMLDPSGRAEVLAVVRRLNRELGMTVVWITHFMDEAVVADRVVVMAEGRVQMVGTPREVFAQADRIRALRLDLPPAVQAAERLRAQGVPLPRTILTLDELVEALCQLYSRP
ncbi:energy-coupling factor transporter ATPase [Symbiobacterium thermophilum]|uniref:Energy-coupling factor transporter ATP-binding protein EcfA1 n=2 Tax=Symbiobacterium thermophilum TaxID=2734 RepID=ECFA1_SYMTH|nr:energy-coupling factor transporter ATPase [Symbiobacterium thermophilum]Q67JX3.1 RecName: Full=Energy-coupling factor transporter ATP-binding protein EcfA1; Short=ECF transporter A component EcfA1 [Symbiobacterium thermophilum IAM 14863]MBY6274784.1 energy-coupling factor transporter ATPase [Symbiobacterium thermophilum]BAD42027.1 ABC-type cobalt transport system ATPase component [Symbiobacterium thermophilum IAM 14863]